MTPVVGPAGLYLTQWIENQSRVLIGREIRWTRGQTDVLEGSFPTAMVK